MLISSKCVQTIKKLGKKLKEEKSVYELPGKISQIFSSWVFACFLHIRS